MKFNPGVMESRKGLRRVVYRSGANKNNLRSKYAVLVVGTLLLWFIIVLYHSVITVNTSISSLIVPLPEEPIWSPYQLTSDEVSTGRFSDETLYTGVYQYIERINVSSTKTSITHIGNHYRIFFPVDFIIPPNTNFNVTNVGREYNHDEVSSTYLITHSGNKGHRSPNQDRCIIIQDFNKQHSNDWFVAALFDGHGDLGHVTSHVAVTEIPLLLLQSILMIDSNNAADKAIVSNNLIPTIIKEIFHKIDTSSIIAQVPRGGSTAVIVLHYQNTVFIASTGDSTAYLIQWSGTTGSKTVSATTSISTTNNQKKLPYTIIKSAIHHKPSNPLERKRIESNGGQVYIPPQDSHESSRVIYKSLNRDGKVMQTGLAMSRSLGDTTAKELQVVISDPDVITFTLPDPTKHTVDHDNYFIILASDGIMDVTKTSDLIISIGEALYDETANSATETKTSPLRTISHQIVQRAIKAWNHATGNQYRDDMSLVVHKVL